MNRWLTTLKNFENAQSAHLPKPSKLVRGGFEGSRSAQISEIFRPSEDEMWGAFEERAAILEYDGGHSRQEAERLARAEIYGEE